MVTGVTASGEETSGEGISDAARGRSLRTTELALDGMHCAACASRIETALRRQPGVASASVNFATTRAYVSYEPGSVGIDGLREAVAGAGYSATEVEPGQDVDESASSEHWATRSAISWALAIVAFAIAVFGPESAVAGWTVLLLAAAVELIGGWPFIKAAVRIAFHGGTSMDTLIVVGTLAALAVSAIEAVALGGRHVHLGGGGVFAARLHGVMGPLIISILATGRAIEYQARRRANRAMHSLLGLRPPTARVVSDPEASDGQLVAPESIPVGALVRVRAGETIPLDGTIVSGESDVDESMLTGEPFPVARGPESTVTGGTRNLTGAVVVRVDAIAAESVLAKLQRLVEEAQRERAPLQRIADRVSSVFVPAVLIGTAATFLAWWLVAGDFGKAVLSAIALLLVACPCAMGLATPVALMVGSGRGSALGILIRGGESMEALAKVNTVAFDKTGTLTEAAATVSAVIGANGWTSGEVLDVAAAVERESAHPIGAAIREAGGAPNARAVDVQEMPAVGVKGVVDGHAVEVVSAATIGAGADGAAKHGVGDTIRDAVREHHERGESVVVVIHDSVVVGAIAVSSAIRREAPVALEHVRSMGLRTAVLSGDSAPAVSTVASALGIDDARSSLTPADKVEAIRSFQSAGRHVVMVGDGINDAPALAASDVGCAIGSGTDAALANSGVALMGNDLEGVPAAIGLARSTLAVIRENLGWAMGYNVSAIPLAAAGLLDPLIAAIAMGLSSLVVVLNSLRLVRFGRAGLTSVRPPLVMRGARGFAVSVAIPVILFAGATVIGEAVSPARGQSLLPTLPDITDVTIAGGVVGETYLEPGSPGVNGFHLVFTRGGNPVAVTHLTADGSHDGAAPEPLRLVELSRGHYVSYQVLASGTWRFEVDVTGPGAKHSRFEVTNKLR